MRVPFGYCLICQSPLKMIPGGEWTEAYMLICYNLDRHYKVQLARTASMNEWNAHEFITDKFAIMYDRFEYYPYRVKRKENTISILDIQSYEQIIFPYIIPMEKWNSHFKCEKLLRLKMLK